MPLFIPSRSIDEPCVPPEWLKVQRRSDIFDEMCFDLIEDVYRRRFEPLLESARARDEAVDEVGLAFALCAHDHVLFAIDQSLGASRCIKGPTLVHATYSCARSALEACSTLHWLLEPGETTGTKGRFAKLLEWYKRDNENERKRTGESRDSDSFAKKIKGAIDIANELGIEHEPKKRKQGPVFATEYNATERAGNFVESGDSEYRLYSGVLHCDTLALSTTWMANTHISNPGETEYAPDRALGMITNLIVWVARATHEFYAYCGHDLDDLNKRLQVYLTHLRVHKSRRTWATETKPS